MSMQPDGSYVFHMHFIAPHMMAAITRYIDHGIIPGRFLQAVIANDLRGAVGQADATNLANLPAFPGYFYNEANPNCYGSYEAMNKWAKSKQAAA